MQRVIQRTQRAERNAKRKLEQAKKIKAAGEKEQRTFQQRRFAKVQKGYVREARINREVDWETGPLAPRRDVGEKADKYGCLSVYDLHPPDIKPEARRKWIHIEEGDRVALTGGSEKGKIGVVQEVSWEKDTVRLRGINMVDVYVPEWLRTENETTSDIQTVARHMSIDAVRLVYPLPDPKTGVYRDVIIDRLERRGGKGYEDKDPKRMKRGVRVIAGTNIIIPWPEMVEPEYEEHEDDTNTDLETTTFVPFLLRPPMPISVIDELRGKYSKFRTRHDYEYIQKKELEDAKAEERKGLIKTMRTPLQELAELRAKQKQLQKKELTQDQLIKIGQIIAQQRDKATDSVKAWKQ